MKLAECREILKTLSFDDPKRRDIIKEMNRINKWMVEKGHRKEFKYGASIKPEESELYPWHVAVVWIDDLWMIKECNNSGINYERDGTVHMCKMCNI